MKRLIKFKKHEREAIIDQIMDYWNDHASTEDLVREVRALYTTGFAKDFVPYGERTDEELCEEAFTTFYTKHYTSYVEFFEMVMENEKRVEKAAKFFYRKGEHTS